VTYVGQTKRRLKTKLKGHKNNLRMNLSKHLVILTYVTRTNHSFDWDNVKIDRNLWIGNAIFTKGLFWKLFTL